MAISAVARLKLFSIACAVAISFFTVASSSSSTTNQKKILKYHDGKKERTIQPLVHYSDLHNDDNNNNGRRERSTSIHTYHASSMAHPPHLKYEARSLQPKKRRDINPLEPMESLRFVNYTHNNNHQEKEERDLRTRHPNPHANRASKPPIIPQQPKSTFQQRKTTYQPLRIHYDTTELQSWANNNTSSLKEITQTRIQYLTNYVLPATAQLWSESLSVYPASSPLLINHKWCPFASKEHSPSFTTGVANADIVIYVTANGAVCRENESVLASAHSCYWDQYQRPIGGNIDFCLDMIEEEGHLLIMNDNDETNSMRVKRQSERYGGWSLHDVHDVIARANEDDEENIVDVNDVVEIQDDYYEETINTKEDDAKENEKGPEYTPLTNAEEEEIITSQRSKSNKLLAMAIGTAMHEFAHVLGVTSDDLLFFYDPTTGLPRTTNPTLQTVECITPGHTMEAWMPSNSTLRKVSTLEGVKYYEIVTPIVAQVVQNQFNCPSATGVRLENQPTNPADCFGSHFEERYFLTENMSPVLGGIPEILSSLTLALLHDSGWYEPNYEMVRVSPFGHGAGCDFLEGACLDRSDGGSVPEYSRNYFCNAEYQIGGVSASLVDDQDTDGDDGGGGGGRDSRLGCDVTHTHIGYCDLVDYQKLNSATNNVDKFDPPEEQYSYFSDNEFLGALMETTDFCPIYSIDPISCREITSATASGKLPKFQNLPFLTQRQIESTGPNARCFNTNSVRPICLNAKCDEESHSIKVMIGEDEFVCKEDGEMIYILGTDLEFECPRLADMCPDLICPANCAGHGKCDYSLSNPECQCFIESDKSAGCYNSFEIVAPKVVWDDYVVRNGVVSSMGGRLGWGICFLYGFTSILLVYTII